MNIVLLSTIYPLPGKDNKGTPVCHYFTREWVKDGHSVLAIHVQSVYPRCLYWVARLFRRYIASKTGAVVYLKRDNCVSEYSMEGVPVVRIPFFKPKPHGKYTKRAMAKGLNIIINKCKGIGFVPDVIVGHFPNPQIEIVSKLKQIYPKATTSVVMHGDNQLPQAIYGDRFKLLQKNIDVWGFRSVSVKNGFERRYGAVAKHFICYSGIPKDYIAEHNKHTFSSKITKFLYVGELIERKYPANLVDALASVYKDKSFRLVYVGEGYELKSVKEKTARHGLEKQVSAVGKITRQEIITHYDDAECFIMISRGEAYGLVYLEAMARGCIVVASKKEGFDGIIVDGVNGFLCEAGNTTELAFVIQHMNSLSPEQKQAISDNAIQTAKRLTDSNAARLYLQDLLNA